MATELEQVQVDSRAQWRAWLAEHHATAAGIWAVTWKKGRGPAVTYEELVEEALCFGWIDSKGRRVDDERTALLLTPRRSASGWSRPNKARVERLTAAGLMQPAGQAVVQDAQRTGAWNALDDVEALVEPPDLASALDDVPAARAAYDGFPRSAKRAILLWVTSARAEATRARRIATTVSEAAQGRRANQ